MNFWESAHPPSVQGSLQPQPPSLEYDPGLMANLFEVKQKKVKCSVFIRLN